jgi:hypothetical protein
MKNGDLTFSFRHIMDVACDIMYSTVYQAKISTAELCSLSIDADSFPPPQKPKLSQVNRLSMALGQNLNLPNLQASSFSMNGPEIVQKYHFVTQDLQHAFTVTSAIQCSTLSEATRNVLRTDHRS